MAGWKPLKIGAGGFITGYDTSNDGTTRVIRTDTYGGYIWNSGTSTWNQITTSLSMATQAATPNNGNYIYEVVVAPGTATRIYMWWHGQMFLSDNSGTTWTLLSNYNGGVTAIDAILLGAGGQSFASRLYGKKMAVDPNNADKIIVGSYVNGLQISSNAGSSWSSLDSQVPLCSVNGYQINNVGGYGIGVSSIAVDTGTAGIPSGTQIWFAGVSYAATSTLASGSGTITIAPALSASVADNQVLQDASGYCIAFDPSTANTVYVASWGNGVYKSTDGGSTFSKLTGGTGGSTTFQHLVVATDGIVYTLDNSGTSVIQKYTAGAWTDISPGQGQNAIAVDPNNSARIVACGGGFLWTTTNRGTNWSFTVGANWGPNCLSPIQASELRSASDVPWLAWTQECIMSAADIRFDPVLPGTTSRLWFAEGIGVWYYDFGSTSATPTTQITWTSQSAGIEQLVVNWIVSPPSGNPSVYCWDRPVFYKNNLDAYPSTHGPNAAVPINMGWSAYYSPSTPTTLVALFNWFGSIEYSGISTNGGSTWTPFVSVPSGLTAAAAIGGSIAINAGASVGASNIVWSPSDKYHPFYTTDGGTTWIEITSTQIPNMPANGSDMGWSNAYYLDNQIIAADQVNASTFYLYNSNTPLLNNYGGIYRSIDGGATWVRTYSAGSSVSFSFPGTGFNDKLRTVPGYAGHMFYTAGAQGSPPGSSATGSFYRSTDGATASAGTQTFTAIANVLGVIAFGFGKIKPGGDYPTVFLAGYVSGVYGIWQGDGTAAQWAASGGTGTGVTWTNLGANPLGSFDSVKAIEGDANTYGQVYIGWSGSGAGYYDPSSGAVTPAFGFSVITDSGQRRTRMIGY